MDNEHEEGSGFGNLSLLLIYLGVFMWLQGALAARAGNSAVGYLVRFLSAITILAGELFITAAIWYKNLANAAALCLVVYIALFGIACAIRERSYQPDEN